VASSLKIDALFTQFGYASFISNKEDTASRRNAVIDKLEKVKEQIEFFKPAFVIPFASFIYFSHVENFYNNDLQTDIREVVDVISKTDSLPSVLYPGDVFSFKQKNNSIPLKKYVEDWQKIKPCNSSESIKFEVLKLKANVYLKRMRSFHGNSAIIFLLILSPIYKLLGKNPFNEVLIHIIDLSITIVFNIGTGLKISKNSIEPDIYLGSQSLGYLFDFDWGFDSLWINGRMQVKNEVSKHKVHRVFQMGSLKNSGTRISKNPWKTIFSFSKIGYIKPLNILLQQD
jgi:hypothetical protein